MNAARRRVLASAVAGGAVAAGLAAAWWHRTARADDPLAPMWAMRFERPEGGELAMQSLRGQPLLINFWATWCAPCIRELPEIDRFQKEFSKRQGRVLALAIDGPTPVRDFLKRRPLGLLIGIGGIDGVDLVQQLGNAQGGLPFTVLIGAEGRILKRKMGETSYAELQAWTGSI